MTTKKINTGIKQNEETKNQNTDWISQETKDKQKQIIEIMNSKNPMEEIEKLASKTKTPEEKKYVADIISKILALNSINIYTWKFDHVKNILREAIMKIDYTKLENVSFILVEETTNNNYSTDFKWINRAFDIYIKNPENKIILVSALVLEDIKKHTQKDSKLNFLLAQKNVKFLNLFDSTTFENVKKETWFNIDEFDKKIKPRPIKIFDPRILETLFEPEKEEETNENILNNIQFHESRWWNPYLKDFFSTLDLRTLNLKNSIVVDLRPDDEKSWDNLSGLKIAYETLQKYPDSKIILCSLIPIDIFQKILKWNKNEEYLNVLLQWKNVRIIQSSWWNSMTKEEVLKQFNGMYQEETSGSSGWSEKFKQLSDISSETSFQKLMSSEISHFLHDATYWTELWNGEQLINEKKLAYLFNLPEEKKNEKWIAFENKLISLLQLQHPSFKLLPRKNNLQWIVDMYKYDCAQLLPEWTRFEWVFIDRDWCLYDNKNLKFNQNIIDMIRDYEKKWKKITIRTWWNLEMKQKLLDEIWLPYTIENKTDYKWWIVEIAIDNDSQEFLLANAKITSEKHIKV